MIMKCSECAAPLEVTEGATYARCQYCGVNVRVRPPEAQALKELLSKKRELLQPPPQAPRPAQDAALKVVLMATGMSLLGVMAGAALFLTDPGDTEPPVVVAEEPGLAQFGSPICLLDANGDGADDVLGMSGRGKYDQPTLLDGANGKVLWQSDARVDNPQLVCLDTRWFAVVAPNFQAEFYDVRNLGAPLRVLLRDRLKYHAIGAGCVQLETLDGSKQGIELPTGNAVTCVPTAAPIGVGNRSEGMLGLTDREVSIEHEGRRYTLKKRPTGSAVLTLEVTDAQGQTAWSRELPYVSPSFNSGIVTNGRTIAIWAAEPGAEDQGLLVGLDANTGEQRYVKPARTQISHSFAYWHSNGRYLIHQIWSSLHAYDIDTGGLVWKIGT